MGNILHAVILFDFFVKLGSGIARLLIIVFIGYELIEIIGGVPRCEKIVNPPLLSVGTIGKPCDANLRVSGLEPSPQGFE